MDGHQAQDWHSEHMTYVTVLKTCVPKSNADRLQNSVRDTISGAACHWMGDGHDITFKHDVVGTWTEQVARLVLTRVLEACTLASSPDLVLDGLSHAQARPPPVAIVATFDMISVTQGHLGLVLVIMIDGDAGET